MNNIIEAYPNPSSGLFSMRLKTTTECTVQVYNSLGERVKKVKTGGGSVEIDLNDQPKGMYILQVFSAEQNLGYGKIVIQ